MRIVIEFLQKKFLLRSPRILVSGLNPHAGEKGHLGLEELEIIEPELWIRNHPKSAESIAEVIKKIL